MVTRTLIPRADPKWIYLGCIIPDVAWMLQRLVTWLDLGIDRYELRLYAIVQSSFAVSLLLSGAIAAVSQAPRRAFNILALNCLVHLLLDALQTKWANGVHLFAPVSWHLLNFGLFWPESIVTYLLTAFGLVAFGYLTWRNENTPMGLSFNSPRRNTVAVLLLGAFLLVPYMLRSGPEQADNHSIRTLRAAKDRAGRCAEFDRIDVIGQWAGPALQTFSGETIALVGATNIPTGCVSLRGEFLDCRTFRVDQFHVHDSRLRELGSWVGLILVVFSWLPHGLLRHAPGTKPASHDSEPAAGS